MCGIIGYIGNGNATKIILDGLKQLEYRGYDSSGIATLVNGKVSVRKQKGKVGELVAKIKKYPSGSAVTLGHNRWATHGEPSNKNAHPHVSCDGKIAVVHNGIIENYQALKKDLIKEGHTFSSDTDTEVIPHLIEKFYKGDLEEAVRKCAQMLRGAYAIGAIHADEPDKLVAARCDSPLIVGLGKNENFIASDAPAILEHTKDVIYLENHELASLQKDKVRIFDLKGRTISRKPTRIKWDAAQAKKGGYDHFMLKEIFEQPKVLEGIIRERVIKGKVVFDELEISDRVLKSFKNIAMVACGTAYHAGLTGKYVMEKLLRVPVWSDTSSEFRYRDPIINKDTLTIVISQSGETADTLAALREAKKRGSKVLAICNTLGSSIARESDGVIYIHAGPEIAVASTKAYTAQLAILYLLTIYLGRQRGIVSAARAKKLLTDFKKTARLSGELLQEYKKPDNKLAKYANQFRSYFLKRGEKGFFLYLGRGANYPNALEGALKLKEISYISAEGYPAGEMKHGPIALIDENPWVVAIATHSDVYEKMLSNIQEIKARGGIVIAVATQGDKHIREQGVNYIVEVPKCDDLFAPLLVAIPMQLWAYYVAREFGYEIDQPRNLAKSVTVE